MKLFNFWHYVCVEWTVKLVWDFYKDSAWFVENSISIEVRHFSFNTLVSLWSWTKCLNSLNLHFHSTPIRFINLPPSNVKSTNDADRHRALCPSKPSGSAFPSGRSSLCRGSCSSSCVTGSAPLPLGGSRGFEVGWSEGECLGSLLGEIQTYPKCEWTAPAACAEKQVLANPLWLSNSTADFWTHWCPCSPGHPLPANAVLHLPL